jgi:hypothetical protein
LCVPCDTLPLGGCLETFCVLEDARRMKHLIVTLMRRE